MKLSTIKQHFCKFLNALFLSFPIGMFFGLSESENLHLLLSFFTTVLLGVFFYEGGFTNSTSSRGYSGIFWGALFGGLFALYIKNNLYFREPIAVKVDDLASLVTMNKAQYYYYKDTNFKRDDNYTDYDYYKDSVKLEIAKKLLDIETPTEDSVEVNNLADLMTMSECQYYFKNPKLKTDTSLKCDNYTSYDYYKDSVKIEIAKKLFNMGVHSAPQNTVNDKKKKKPAFIKTYVEKPIVSRLFNSDDRESSNKINRHSRTQIKKIIKSYEKDKNYDIIDELYRLKNKNIYEIIENNSYEIIENNSNDTTKHIDTTKLINELRKL